jgi:hypothetical protein
LGKFPTLGGEYSQFRVGLVSRRSTVLFFYSGFEIEIFKNEKKLHE